MFMKFNKKLLAVAITTALFSGQAAANDAKYQQLEAKIASLESMLMELKQELAEKPTAAPSTKAPEKQDSGEQHSYSFGGFVKATASFSAYSDGDLAGGSVGRDFYIPGTIPVGGEGESTDFDFKAKESGINFKATKPWSVMIRSTPSMNSTIWCPPVVTSGSVTLISRGSDMLS
jgi:hypothetical protein